MVTYARMALTPAPAPARNRSGSATSLDISGSYRQHARFVWRFLRHLGVPHAFAEDAVHDVFLVVSRRAASFDGNAAVRPWLVGIARRVAMDYRKLSRRRERRHQALYLHVAREPGDGGLPRLEAARQVAKLLASLPERLRLVLVLADLEGWTAPEIAAALETPVNTIYTQLAKARRKLEALATEVGPIQGDA